MINIVAGHNFFIKHTQPMIASMREHNPEIPIVLIDNGSDPPYPDIPNIKQVRHDNSSLSGAINKGIAAAGEHDWYLWINNDVLITEHIEFGDLDENCLYGPEIDKKDKIGYIFAWWMLIPGKAWEKVGEFDPEYLRYTYEDVDYCYRAEQAGFKLQVKKLPFKHYLHGTELYNPDINYYRKRNIAYFKSKFSLPEDTLV